MPIDLYSSDSIASKALSPTPVGSLFTILFKLIASFLLPISFKKAIISLAEGTENNITDGETYVFEDESSNDPNAAIFSKDDMTIIGSGKLTVNANYNNGIASNDDLKIQSGNIIVNANL